MKLIIAGGRDFNNEQLMRDSLQQMVADGLIDESVVLICGKARGADMLGYRLFKEQQLPILEYVPDWDKLGNVAGFIRNTEMGNVADLALIFWDGQSRGTKHMIDYMKRLNKPVTLVRY